MTTAFANFFLLALILVSIAAGAACGIRFLSQKRWLSMRGKDELGLNYFFISLCLSLPVLVCFSKNSFQLQPVAKIESAASFHDFDLNRGLQSGKPILTVSQALPTLPAERVFQIFSWTLALSFCFGIFRLIRDLFLLRRTLKNSVVIRRVGGVRIAVSDRVQVPFSIWAWRSWVIVPQDLIVRRDLFRISVLHELQHHRQKDTLWIYLVLLMKSLFCLNPLVWVWVKVISEVQELACDENLVDQGKVRRQEYACRLIEIAETIVNEKERPAGAAGLAFFQDRKTLIRRIESMFQKRKSLTKWTQGIGMLVLITLAGGAFAARELISDRRISKADAIKLAEHADALTEFPIVMNDAVLKQLNRYVGTEEGRKFISGSLERMKTYQPMLDQKLTQYQMPAELLAIGVVESGYQNLAQVPNKTWSAGIWMFIASTARNYGLNVDATTDERLNVEAETDAAMRYLAGNQLRFKDWLLAIQAYNTGEQAVQVAIEKYGSRDVWTLLRQGLPTDRDYLAKVMAMVIIMKNPQVLE